MILIPKFLKFILKITGKFSHLKISVPLKHVWHGSTYGGFYLSPELLNKKSIVYSFGIGEDVSFDNAVIKNYDCTVFAFDPTPKSINFIKQLNPNKKFFFYGFGISSKSEFVDFYLPNNPEHISGSIITQKNVNLNNTVRVEMKSLKHIMSELGHKHIDVLKMDIEGSEYDVIEDILNSNISITQILVEFHDRLFENGYQKSIKVINALKLKGYEIFAVSESFEEVSFINKNII